jgi:hypothetical protein
MLSGGGPGDCRWACRTPVRQETLASALLRYPAPEEFHAPECKEGMWLGTPAWASRTLASEWEKGTGNRAPE